jgi:hypothetical protein
MPKETITDSGEGNLVRLKYTFRFGDKFDESNDDWLKCIEATSDELLGAYSKAEDNALSVAFGGQNKKRLNRLFDAIGFVYPDYCYPLQRQGVKRKIAASGKVVASATTTELKGKKIKVLTHRPRYIEPAVIPEFGKGSSSAAEAKENVLTAQITEEPTVMPKVLTVGLVEMKIGRAEEPKIEEIEKMPKNLSPPTEATLLKVQKASDVTPKRRRWLGWPIFKGRLMKLLRKCVILLKMTKTEGPNTGSFVKRAYSTKMDSTMILIMIPLLLMMLLPWQQNCRLSHGHNPTSHPSYPCTMGARTQNNF